MEHVDTVHHRLHPARQRIPFKGLVDLATTSNRGGFLLDEPMGVKPSNLGGQCLATLDKWTKRWSIYGTEIGDPTALVIRFDVRSPTNAQGTKHSQIEQIAVYAAALA